VHIVPNLTDGSNYRVFDSKIIPYSPCQLGKNIFYENVEEVEQFNIENYFCADWNNLTVQGNWYAPVHARIELLFQRCLPSESNKNCATDEEFDYWIRGITLQQIIISSYFDIQAYDDKTVRYYMEDSFISFKPDASVVQTIFLKKNFLELDDNIFGLFNTKVANFFYQVSRKESFLTDDEQGPGPGIYFYELFKLDSEYDIYERQVYTITGVLRDVGGFYNSLYFLGLFLYSQFQGSFFFASFISKLYQVEQLADGPPGGSHHHSDRPTLSERRNSRVKVDDHWQSTENLPA
jgi:hypothetical protein